MEPYSFWQDFFSTYRASPDAIKALWLTMPPTFVLGVIWIVVNAKRMRSHRSD